MTKQRRVCEASFFSGELTLMQGTKENAARLFRLAAGDCPKTLIVWSAANALGRHICRSGRADVVWSGL